MKGQAPDDLLAREQFAFWHQRVRVSLSDADGHAMMRYLMLIHDTGKGAVAAGAVASATNSCIRDHDLVLRAVLDSDELTERLLPSLSDLGPLEQNIIRDVIHVECNLGQVLQGEAPAGVLASWRGIKPHVRTVYLVHLLLDLAGAQCRSRQEGGTGLTSGLSEDYAALWEVVSEPERSAPDVQYDSYLRYRMRLLGLENEILDARNRALVRIALMLRLRSPERMQTLQECWEDLDPSVRSTLEAELCRTGIGDNAILPYYGPAFLSVVSHAMGVSHAITLLAHRLSEARELLTGDDGGVVSLDLGPEARRWAAECSA